MYEFYFDLNKLVFPIFLYFAKRKRNETMKNETEI